MVTLCVFAGNTPAKIDSPIPLFGPNQTMPIRPSQMADAKVIMGCETSDSFEAKLEAIAANPIGDHVRLFDQLASEKVAQQKFLQLLKSRFEMFFGKGQHSSGTMSEKDAHALGQRFGLSIFQG